MAKSIIESHTMFNRWRVLSAYKAIYRFYYYAIFDF